jgi:hypothetical protein
MPRTTHRRGRALLAAAALAAALMAAVPAGAQAAHQQDFRAGAVLLDQPKGRPWALALKLGADLDYGREYVVGETDPVDNMQFKFPVATVNGNAFATCDPKRIQARKSPKACPADSLIGTGSAVADATLTSTLDAKIWVFNGKGNSRQREIVVFAKTTQTGVEVNLVLRGALKRISGGGFGWQLDLPVPRIDTVIGAPPAAVRRFEVTVMKRKKVGRQRISYIEAPTVCPARGLPFQANFHYMDQKSSGPIDKKISCTLTAV